jgi:cerevisin
MDNNTPQSVLDQLQEHELVHSVVKELADAIGLQDQAPWGLARLISDGPLGTVGSKDEDKAKYTYVYDKDTAGRNVTVYMLCTGVRADHETFEGRVSAPADANFIEPGKPQEDAVGQGTHTAGTVLSSAYGAAKQAKLVSIKVFDVESVTSSPILQGINYAIKKAKHDEGPSILLIPIEGTANDAVDLACKRALRHQIHVVVASGNSGADAVDVSPARLAAESALITVSASRIDDMNLDYSNFGDVVTVWAPGSRILSAYPSSKTGAAVASGTAVASAHVAGLLAVWLSE